MLSESEINERAIYCYSVFLQLNWLYSNEFIEPGQYLDYLKKSSLGLGEDEFIITTVQDALIMGQGEGAIQSLITLYEGFAGAFCEVLEIPMENMHTRVSRDIQKMLALEVGVDIKL